MVAELCEEEVYGEELVRIGTKRGWKKDRAIGGAMGDGRMLRESIWRDGGIEAGREHVYLLYIWRRGKRIDFTNPKHTIRLQARGAKFSSCIVSGFFTARKATARPSAPLYLQHSLGRLPFAPCLLPWPPRSKLRLAPQRPHPYSAPA